VKHGARSCDCDCDFDRLRKIPRDRLAACSKNKDATMSDFALNRTIMI
jgi:hypothetical protein